MMRFVLVACLAGWAMPTMAKPSLVCRVTAWVPYTAAIRPGFDNTRIFTQAAGLVEERRAGNSVIHHWTVIADTPDQLIAVDEGRALKLTVDRPGNTFAESGVLVQRRGYCRMNELP